LAQERTVKGGGGREQFGTAGENGKTEIQIIGEGFNRFLDCEEV